MKAGHSPQEAIVGVQAFGRLSPGALDLRLLKPRLDGTNDARGHAILQINHVFEMRTLAETFGTPSARRTVLNVALDYERTADPIERVSPIGSGDRKNRTI
jgi:hypothetical protein